MHTNLDSMAILLVGQVLMDHGDGKITEIRVQSDGAVRGYSADVRAKDYGKVEVDQAMTFVNTLDTHNGLRAYVECNTVDCEVCGGDILDMGPGGGACVLCGAWMGVCLS